ncbi:MAG TPA: riboflavin synthase [Steroidobacteraceae bacterium]|nr:riboflavin synthase [Steroidobacteraceae bacterium]
MFTGIIATTGRITSLAEKGGDLELGIDAAAGAAAGDGAGAPALDLDRIAIGDSVSVQGVCLTVTRKEGTRFYADVSRETMAKTTLGILSRGSRVNLEPSLRAGEPLGGHLVSGHVDAVGTLRALARDARSWRMEFELPVFLMRFVAPKGSICVNGVSLTVNRVDGSRFDVNIIPHTLKVTTLGELKIDDVVNVEIDVIARYLDRLMTKPDE